MTIYRNSNFWSFIILGFMCFMGSINTCQAQDTAAQEQLVITIGDTLTFNSLCDSGIFQHIDLYVKTRYSDSILRYNPTTGQGFHNSFFEGGGDFDATRLPCSYNGKQFAITATQYFEDKNTGETRFVVFVVLENWRKVAWIEFVNAYQAGEVLLKEK